jgi:hypothetical protein
MARVGARADGFWHEGHKEQQGHEEGHKNYLLCVLFVSLVFFVFFVLPPSASCH